MLSVTTDNLHGMTETDPERTALTYYLHYQRSSVAAIIDGLDEAAWHTAVLPSGWTVAGLIQHLGDMEGHWAYVIDGQDPAPAYDDGRPADDQAAPFTSDRSAERVLNYYREQCARFDEVFEQMSLSATPLGRHAEDDAKLVPTVRWIALHVIEETAAHTGHLEAARELLDGRTDLGLR